MVEVKMKKCPKCGETKPEIDFYKDKKNKDRLTVYCKKCVCRRNEEYRKARYKRRKALTEKQHKVLHLIDELKQQHGKFPSYKELAAKIGTSRQDIDCCLDHIQSRYKKMAGIETEKDKFIRLEKSIKTGWVALRIRLKDGEIIKQTVTSSMERGKSADI
jgi:DNA-directed RNA polymerase specialized sigma subunit